MVIFNALEDLRRRENTRRGYSEVKTPLIYDKALWETSGHWEKFRENMFLIPAERGPDVRDQADELPRAHAALRQRQLRSYRDLPIRYAEAAPLHRNELVGALHGLTRVRYVTQDDAHIFCTREQIDAELDGCIEYLKDLYGLFGIEPRAELSTQARQQARHRRGVGLRRGRARGGARAPRDRVLRRRGRGLVLRAEDRPARAATCSAARGSSGRSSSTRRCRAASASRTWAPTTPSIRSSSSTARSSARSSASSACCSSTTPATFPLLARARAGAAAPRRRVPSRRRRGSLRDRVLAEGYRVDVDERDETLGKRIRDAELEKLPYVVVYGDKESDEALAVRERGGEQSTKSLDELLAELRPAGCYSVALPKQERTPPLTSRARAPWRFNRADRTSGRGRCLQRLLSSRRRSR